jgi:NAD(P)-dependent dehydrogenase (short-subunit alcohol dehydrogenase family)
MIGSGLFRLDGKRALITGAGRGIGRAVACGLAEYGAQVTLCARTASELEAAVEEIRKTGGRAEAFVHDVTDIEGFARAIATEPAFDILVNNAGTNRPKPLSEVTVEDYQVVMDLNLRAVVFVTQAVTRRMAECGTKGSVINISSQMGMSALPTGRSTARRNGRSKASREPWLSSSARSGSASTRSAPPSSKLP